MEKKRCVFGPKVLELITGKVSLNPKDDLAENYGKGEIKIDEEHMEDLVRSKQINIIISGFVGWQSMHYCISLLYVFYLKVCFGAIF